MSKVNIYIKAPDYISQWLRHEYWDAESERVVFPRGSAPRAILVSLLRKKPAAYEPVPSPNLLAIEVPSIRGLSPEQWCYLAESGKAALVSGCKKMFQANMWTELQELFAHDVQITDIIYDYMDRHGIEATEKNWETLRQMYCRMRKKSRSMKG